MVNAIVVPNGDNYNADVGDGFGGNKGGEGNNDSAVAPFFLVLDGSRFCVSRTKNGKEKCECK